MVNYSQRISKTGLKPLARKILTQPQLNFVLVGLVSKLPQNKSWASRLPVVGRSATLNLKGGGTITLADTARCAVAKEVYWSKGHLDKAADRLALEAAIVLSKDAGLFIDVGAYTGLFALSVARSNPNTKAYAYEIVPENFLSLWRNVLLNKLVGQIEPRLTGLGAGEGEIRIPMSFGSGVLASSVALDATEAEGIRIPVSSLDIEHGSYSCKAVIKIDVETFEWPVLSGGRGFIERSRPDIICEVLRRAPHILELSDYLKRQEYTIYHITDDGLRLATQIVPTAAERDWLFTTRTSDELRSMGLPVV